MSAKLGMIAALTLTALVVRAEDVAKLSLDDTSSTSPRIEVDTQVKAEGRGSIRITTQWPTTVFLGEIQAPDIEDAKLVYSAKVKTDLQGTTFLEMWAQVAGGQYFSKGLNDTVGQKTDWKTIRTPFVFQKGQKPDKITLNLVINGKGTLWIDDVVLSKEPLR